MKFTPKQLQYLFYIDLYKDSSRLTSNLADQLEVSKAAVSQVLDFHEAKGLIRRCEAGGIVIADQAEKVISEIREKHKIIFPFFQRMPELTEEMAVKCALQYICWMPRESVDGLVRSLKEKDELSRIRWDLSEETEVPFPDGRYQVSFDVYKKDSDEISMGDKGFIKPAQMVVMAGKGAITLRSKEIRYQSRTEARFRGRLTHLGCLYGDRFVQIKARDNEYTIPLHYIRKLYKAPDGTLCGTLRVRVETSKCAANMPISEADIVFKFM